MKSSPENYVSMRRAQPSETLHQETSEWLNQLPATVRPQSLPMDFARIANALHARWSQPQDCLNYFDDLLIDRRGNRQGFPGVVAMEIATLKDHYESHVHRWKQTAWDQIAGERRH